MLKRIQKNTKPLFVYKKALLKREFSLIGLRENILIILGVIPLSLIIYLFNVIIYCMCSV